MYYFITNIIWSLSSVLYACVCVRCAGQKKSENKCCRYIVHVSLCRRFCCRFFFPIPLSAFSRFAFSARFSTLWFGLFIAYARASNGFLKILQLYFFFSSSYTLPLLLLLQQFLCLFCFGVSFFLKKIKIL